MFGFFKRKKKKQQETQLEPAKVFKETKTEEEVVIEEQPIVPEPVEVEPEETKAKPRKMSYHITKHPKGGWQIKKGGADRALKRFNTQKEAIEYAKELEKNGASYIIHKTDGTTRKKTY